MQKLPYCVCFVILSAYFCRVYMFLSHSCVSNDDEWSEWSLSEDEDEVEVGGDDDSDIDDVNKPDAESMCNKVIQFIRGLCILINFARIVGKMIWGRLNNILLLCPAIIISILCVNL